MLDEGPQDSDAILDLGPEDSGAALDEGPQDSGAALDLGPEEPRWHGSCESDRCTCLAQLLVECPTFEPAACALAPDPSALEAALAQLCQENPLIHRQMIEAVPAQCGVLFAGFSHESREVDTLCQGAPEPHGCPDGMVGVAGTSLCLWVSASKERWSRITCRKSISPVERYEGQMASLHGYARREAARALIAEYPKVNNIWVGAQRGSPDRLRWWWLDGVELFVGDPFWGFEEPNDQNTENCAELQTESFKLNDKKCTENRYGICEVAVP